MAGEKRHSQIWFQRISSARHGVVRAVDKLVEQTSPALTRLETRVVVAETLDSPRPLLGGQEARLGGIIVEEHAARAESCVSTPFPRRTPLLLAAHMISGVDSTVTIPVTRNKIW